MKSRRPRPLPDLNLSVPISCLLDWPRVRELPEEEREPFVAWLAGKTRPWIDGILPQDQDGFYSTDYDLWKDTLKKRG